MLEIIEEPKKEIYRKLIKYLCKDNDVLMFINRTDGLARILMYFDIICNELKMNEQQLINEYKTNRLKNIFNKIRYKKEIFIIDEWVKEKSNDQSKEKIIKIKQNIIKMIFENYLTYNKKCIIIQLQVECVTVHLTPNI